MDRKTPHNRTAIVTGAGSGIGRACANALVADGWRVAYAGRRREALLDAVACAGDPFGDIGARVLAVPADVTGLTKAAALDGRAHDIAVGQLDIGNAATDMTARMAQGVPQADGSVRPEPVMDVRHVADALVHMAGRPLQANVQFMTVMATQMPFVGRG